jgi:hypothetical protein
VYVLIKPQPLKLFKLKEWLTLPDAAKHLTGVCNEEVTEADILRLALDGHLKLSVNLVNATIARYGKIISPKDLDDATNARYFNSINLEGMDNAKLAKLLNIIDDEKSDLVALIVDAKARYANKVSPDALDWDEFRSELPNGCITPIFSDEGKEIPLPRISRMEDTLFLKLGNEVTIIQGIWDLPMIGSERTYIERRHLEMTSGSKLLIRNSHGACLRGQNGEIYQLQNSLSYDECYPGSVMELAELKRLRDNKSISLGKATTELNRHQKQREIFDKESNVLAFETPADNRYFRAAYLLPQDSVLVVRTHTLREFERLIGENETDNSTATKPHGNAERFAKQREEVLGAALSVITQWPTECQNSSGKFEATKIAKLVDQKSLLYWPKTGEAPLGLEKMEREISKWINGGAVK